MENYFLKEENLSSFVSNLMDKTPVVAPVAKRTRFVFAELESPEELRLDYDTTILPPKKLFFPPKQDLVKFDENGYQACLNPQPKILLGVHPHDIKAIAMTDKLFELDNPDKNYLENRSATTIIGSNVQTHYKHAFFGSVCQELKPTGHDMFLTKITDGYVVEVLTDKGKELLASGEFTDASDTQITEAKEVLAKAEADCPEKLNGTSTEIQAKVRNAFKTNDFWEEASEDCFSCGSCNIVCPTCYCFDVQDDWGLGTCDGVRSRKWDACLTSEFSQVSVQGGTENFREERAERFRHRFMRKTAYLNEKLGGPACVGCGRCSGACTADIANPVTVINKIMEQ